MKSKKNGLLGPLRAPEKSTELTNRGGRFIGGGQQGKIKCDVTEKKRNPNSHRGDGESEEISIWRKMTGYLTGRVCKKWNSSRG